MKKITAILILSFLITAAHCVLADRVTLKGGRVLQGKITELSEDSVTIEDADGLQIKVAADKIENVFEDKAPAKNNADKPPAAKLPEMILQNGHSNEVRAVAISPDGKTLATGGADNTIKLWSLETGELSRNLRGHAYFISTLSYSPDGKFLYSSAQDKTVRVWPLETQAAPKVFQNTDYWAAFNADKTFFAHGGDDGIVRVRSLETGETVREFPGFASPLAFSPDGKYLAARTVEKDSFSLHVFSLESGEDVATIGEHTNFITDAAFSRDGKFIVTASEDKYVGVWSMPTGEMVRMIPQPDAVQSIAISPDGKTAAAGLWEKGIALLSIEDGSTLATTDGHKSLVTSLEFSENGKTLASGSWDFTARVWSAADLAPIRNFRGNLSEAGAVALSPDGNNLATAGYDSNTIKLWNLDTGELEHVLAGHTNTVQALAFSPDGKTLASGSWDSAIRLWSVPGGVQTADLHGHTAAVNGLAFSRDGTVLASAGGDGYVLMWDALKGGLLASLRSNSDFVYSVAFSPDDKLLAGAGGDSLSGVLIWSVETGELIREIPHKNPVSSVSFSRDSKTLATATSFDNSAFLWSVETGGQTGSLNGAQDGIFSAVYAEGCGMIAAAGVDHNLYIWEDGESDPARVLKGHTDSVKSLAFSSDCKTIVSGGRDGTAMVWNAATGAQLATLAAFEDGNWFVTDAAGRFDCSGCAQGTASGGKQYIRWRAGNRLYAPDQFFDKFFEPSLLRDVLWRGEAPQMADIGAVLADVPPEVKITWPPDGTNTDKSETKIKLAVTDNGGGAENVRILSQGRPLFGDPADITPADAAQNERVYEFTARLTPGQNRFTAAATSRAGVDSREAEVTITTNSGSITKPELYLLTVGINEYKNTAYNLRLAVPDADGFAQAIKYGGSDIYAKIHETRLRDAEATQGSLRKALEDIQAAAKPDDIVIIYFAGHGTTAGGGWFFLTHNVVKSDDETIRADAFSERELKQFLKKVAARKVVLAIDACQSGGMALAMSRGMDKDRVLRELARSTGTFILAASTDAQSALENLALGHGVFTYTLLEGLSGKADYNNSGTIEVKELESYAGEKVPEYTQKYYNQRQDPFVWEVSGGGGGFGPTIAAIK